MHSLDFVDSHTGGEPTRVVLSGFPDLGGGPLAARRQRFRDEHDAWRRAIAREPRGSDAMVGALLLPPQDPAVVAGVIFFNNVGYLGMCGHGTIGVMATLAYLGRIGPGKYRLETPVGTVGTELHADGRVSVENVESYRHARGVELDVPGYGRVRGDVAWGGNWFFITADHRVPLTLAHEPELTRYTEAIRAALRAAGITGADGAEIDHVELNGPPAVADVDASNFVLCPGMAYDRSPCGTGSSAKVACLAADGKLAPGAVWRQAGILGSVFELDYTPSGAGSGGAGPDGAGSRGKGVMPRITGRAHVTARGQLLIDDSDELAWGIQAT